MKDSLELVRHKMVTEQIENRGISDHNVLSAMRKVPRHLFIPQVYRHRAYCNGALPIDENQTISQPYIVALMTQSLEIRGGEKVLEIGTGSGYQAAILSEMGAKVFTIERIPRLASQARETLEKLGYGNVAVIAGDGTLGWQEYAPFDRIIVTAAAPEIPQKLVAQLKEDGIMVIPVGSRLHQTLKIIRRKGDKALSKDSVGCVFVPLIGIQGWHKV